MKEAPLPFNEKERLEELHRYEVLDTAAESDIDDLTILAAYICKAPIALVSLVDATRQWFKSRVGIDAAETPRAIAFCAHAILEKDVLIVSDAVADDRFADNPLVTGEPGIRFYAGAPLVSSKGYKLGTLCVIDTRVRPFELDQQEALQILSRQVVQRLEQRRQLKELRRATLERQQSQQEMEASRKQLQEFLDASHELIQRVGPDGRLIYTNRAWHRALGYTPEEATCLSVFDIIHPDSREHCRALLPRLMAGESIPMMEVSLVAKDGRRVEVVGSATCEMSGDGHPIATRTVFHDVTEQKQAEEQLRRSEAISKKASAQLLAVIEASPAGMVLVDTTGKILLTNRQLESLFGYTRGELLGHAIEMLVPEAVRAAHPQQVHRFFTRPASRAMGAGRDLMGRRKDGTEFPVEVGLNPVEIPQGFAAMASVIDITARKQAEDALRNMNVELEARVRERTAALERAYQQINFHLQNTPLGVIQWAPDFKLHHWSSQAERIFGWTAQEVEGKYPHEWPFIPEEERPAMQESMERLRSRQERRKVHRVRHCGKNGQDVHCVWHTSVLVDELGQVLSMMALVQDLSEQVQLERQFHQAQKMEAVGRLAGGIAHDFNNLLTVITGYSDLVLMNPKTEGAVKKAVEQILHAGNRATGLTHQLLAFSRQQILQPRTLSLNATVTEAEKMLRRLIGEDVRLTLGLKAHPDTIKADPVQVEQIIMNLAVNARDAMPNGGRLSIDTVTVHLAESLPAQVGGPLSPGVYVSLVVRDTGSGIGEATLAKIFEPFFTTKGPGKGTGLGLATVHGIVQQSGGAITVSSRVGEGTTFQIYFPSVTEMGTVTNVPLPASTIKRGTETILLVEDEPVVRAFVHEVLSTFGYNVLEVRTAEEAMFLSNGYEHPIQLLVTDVVLPFGRGTKLAEELCRKRPGIKVLLMSGHIDQSLSVDKEIVAKLPFLQKPFTHEALLAKAREALDS